MPRPLVKIHDAETNEIIEREMNDAEFAEHQKLVEELENRDAQATASAEAKSALLERLGITEDEAKLLLA